MKLKKLLLIILTTIFITGCRTWTETYRSQTLKNRHINYIRLITSETLGADWWGHKSFFNEFKKDVLGSILHIHDSCWVKGGPNIALDGLALMANTKYLYKNKCSNDIINGIVLEIYYSFLIDQEKVEGFGYLPDHWVRKKSTMDCWYKLFEIDYYGKKNPMSNDLCSLKKLFTVETEEPSISDLKNILSSLIQDGSISINE